VSCTRIARGPLAGLIISNSAGEPDPPVISSRPKASKADEGILHPESRRAIAHAQARQRALRRAQLTGSYHTMGALNWLGFGFAAMLVVCAIVIKANAMWTHPVPPRADVLQLAER
jgi:hypothetical protein